MKRILHLSIILLIGSLACQPPKNSSPVGDSAPVQTKITLIPSQQINLSSTFTGSKINIGATTSSLTIRLKRPTTLDIATVWPKTSIVRVILVAEIDGEKFQCVGQASGGIREDKNGNEITEYSLIYHLPVQMINGTAKRIGETAKTSFKGFISLELLSGTAIKTTLLVAETEEKPAPIIQVHHSVTFDAVTAAQEASGDNILSLSHTSTGSNRAVCATNGNSVSTGVASTSMTYDGTGMAEQWDNAPFGTFFGHAGYSLAGQSTGAQTVTSTLASTVDEHVLGVISMKGVDQSTPIGTPNSATGSGASATVTVTGTTSDGLVVSGMFSGWNGATAGANETERWEEIVSSAVTGAGNTQAGSDGGVMTHDRVSTGFASDWGIGAVEFKAAAGGAPSTRRRMSVTR